jgi:tRNA(fMet)-specific endonuclease VapC
VLYMLDTDICIYTSKQTHPKVSRRFNQLHFGQIGMSVVTYGELSFGARKSSRPTESLRKLAVLLEAIPVLAMDGGVAEHYGRLRSELQRQGKMIGNNDLWIAAHCLQLGLTLVTNNEREFSRIPDLTIENWTD